MRAYDYRTCLRASEATVRTRLACSPSRMRTCRARRQCGLRTCSTSDKRPGAVRTCLPYEAHACSVVRAEGAGVGWLCEARAGCVWAARASIRAPAHARHGSRDHELYLWHELGTQNVIRFTTSGKCQSTHTRGSTFGFTSRPHTHAHTRTPAQATVVLRRELLSCAG